MSLRIGINGERCVNAPPTAAIAAPDVAECTGPDGARLVLDGARQMADEGEMRGETYDALAAHLDHERMVDLVVVIGTYCGLVRILATLAIDVEPEYQAHLDKFPLPVG